MSKSCVGCKFLYSEGVGYSNYTWEEDEVRCAKNKNPHLAGKGQDEPYDWNKRTEDDNWSATNNSRCELYSSGVYVKLDVDGDNGPADECKDEEQIIAICEHAKRGRNGDFV